MEPVADDVVSFAGLGADMLEEGDEGEEGGGVEDRAFPQSADGLRVWVRSIQTVARVYGSGVLGREGR